MQSVTHIDTERERLERAVLEQAEAEAMRWRRYKPSREWGYVGALCALIEDTHARLVFQNLIGWTIRHADRYRWLYLSLTLLTMIVNILIAGLSGNDGFADIIRWMSLSASFIAGVIALFSYKDHWSRYRKTAEALKAEANRYLRQLDCYHSASEVAETTQCEVTREKQEIGERDATALFIKRMLEISGSEVNLWAEQIRRSYSEEPESTCKEGAKA